MAQIGLVFSSGFYNFQIWKGDSRGMSNATAKRERRQEGRIEDGSRVEV
jgi:hypothetical protein